MHKLSKIQKSLICTHLLYFLVIVMLTAGCEDYECLFESKLAQIILLIIPVLVYWSCVWIWGFGCIINFVKNYRKRIKLFFYMLISCFALIILSVYIYEQSLYLNFHSIEEINQGCILPSFKSHKTCLKNKVYYNALLKDIINKKPYSIEFNNIQIDSKNKCEDESFCFRHLYLLKDPTDRIYIEEIKKMEKELKDDNLGEIFEILKSFDTEWENIKPWNLEWDNNLPNNP